MLKKHKYHPAKQKQFVVSIPEAEELIVSLRRAIGEAKDHQTIQAAFLPLSNISIWVHPQKKAPLEIPALQNTPTILEYLGEAYRSKEVAAEKGRACQAAREAAEAVGDTSGGENPKGDG